MFLIKIVTIFALFITNAIAKNYQNQSDKIQSFQSSKQTDQGYNKVRNKTSDNGASDNSQTYSSNRFNPQQIEQDKSLKNAQGDDSVEDVEDSKQKPKKLNSNEDLESLSTDNQKPKKKKKRKKRKHKDDSESLDSSDIESREVLSGEKTRPVRLDAEDSEYLGLENSRDSYNQDSQFNRSDSKHQNYDQNKQNQLDKVKNRRN